MLFEDISKQGFELTIRMATQKLSTMPIEEVCQRSGAALIDDHHLRLIYLNRLYRVNASTGEITLVDKKEDVVPIRDQILILHYLTQARGTPFTNKVITYGQIEGAKFYTPIFLQRSLQPILKNFGQRPELLLELAQRIGGQKAPFGDISVRIDPFPRVRIFIILWRGDAEFPANGNILFDGNIGHYLSSEDVCVLTETLVWKLVRMI